MPVKICLSRFLLPVLAVLLLVCSPWSLAGLFDSLATSGRDQPLPVDQAYQLQGDQLAPGRLALVWQIQPDYYLYRDKITVTPGPGVELLARSNAPSVTKEDPLFGTVEVYHDQARVELLLGGRDGPIDGQIEISYQGCWEGGICYPPVTQTLEVNQLPPASSLTSPNDEGEEARPTGESGAASSTEAPLQGGSEQDRFAGLLSKATLPVVLGVFFMAGLALSLTPCVLPMVPILSGIIVGSGERMNGPRAFWLSLVYVLAMALTYTLAGVVVGLLGANVQAALQTPWVIAAFAAIFVLLALSMFGFYELQMPTWIQSRLSQASAGQKGGSLLGVAVMGFLSALIVGPCMAAPLAGALLYIGQTGDPLLGGLALFALSLGMGVPLLLVGVSAGRLLPKAGRWMEGVKAAFGVLLLLMAVWMLDRVVPTAVTMGLTGVILVVSAVYLRVFELSAEPLGGWQRLWKGVGVVLLIYGTALLIGLLAGHRSLIHPLQGFTTAPVNAGPTQPGPTFTTVTRLSELDPLLAEAAAQGRPVMLDFYADWCVSCIELEHLTFVDPAVQQRLAGFQLIKVDVTANDADAKALNQQYQVFGPPVLFFHDGAGKPRPELTIVGFVEAEPLLDILSTL